MPELTNATRWQRIGSFFQIPMLIVYAAQLVIFREPPVRFWLVQLFEYAGAIMFLWCLWCLYVKKARLKGLITSGLFRYTRNPMYLGLLLMNVCYWVRVSVVWTSPLFLGLEVMFFVGMVMAGYFQEQETLARFGQQAIDYYKRTPRIPFFPW